MIKIFTVGIWQLTRQSFRKSDIHWFVVAPSKLPEQAANKRRNQPERQQPIICELMQAAVHSELQAPLLLSNLGLENIQSYP